MITKIAEPVPARDLSSRSGNRRGRDIPKTSSHAALSHFLCSSIAIEWTVLTVTLIPGKPDVFPRSAHNGLSTYVCANPQCTDEGAASGRHPRSFSADWAECSRRCIVLPPYSANLETRLRSLFPITYESITSILLFQHFQQPLLTYTSP